ncbi:TonB-dependent receptor [Erythrobacter sp.]|jgi:iron complex outermembrane receptor protein|uniref:TonB-dependent receptor n=1 Tax=Erythrobacter sp. TaxID=1042 RepID=UPI002EABC070|nr:TonB-dependent receptor [Erythrobacter sp.]
MTSLAALTAAATALPSAALAAQPVSENSETGQDSPRDDDSDNIQDGGLRTIVVTAQRREEALQSVPLAVTALDEEALDTAAIDDLRDFQGRVPGLVVDQVNAGPSAAAVSIRGISFEDIEKSFDPSVGVVIDGVFIGTNTGQLLDAFDLEAIEVLRGPQGTLFGRNTIGGVINIRRSRPTGDFGVKASIGYAEFETIRGRLVVNAPEIADLISLKGFFFYDDTEGYLENVTLDRTQPNYEIWTAGVTAGINLGGPVEALITYEHSREEGEVSTASLSRTGTDLICLQVPVPGVGTVRAFGIPDEECDRPISDVDALYTVFSNIEQPVRNDTDALTGEINVDIGEFALTSITGWRRNEESVRQDFDSTSIDFFDTLRVQDYEQFSQEVRMAGDVTPWLNALVGAYYFDSEYNLDQTTNLGFAGLQLRQFTTGTAESIAVFGDVQIELTDALTLSGGVRYTDDEKALFTNFGFTPDGSCATFLGLAEDDCSGEVSFDEFTYRGAIDFQIDPDKLVYASYSRGFRSGGFNGRAATPSSLGPFEPETVDAYEIGLKADWLDNRLRTNFALYQTDYNNKQEELVRATAPEFAALNPQETVVENAASARIRGFEAEVVAVPTDQLTFNFSLSIIDADYQNFERDVDGDLIPDDVSSLDLRRAAPITWSAGFDYILPVGDNELQLNSIFRFTDEYSTCIVADPLALQRGVVTNDVRCTVDTKEILDVTLSYTVPLGPSEVRLSVFGRNLFDDRGINSTLPVAGLFTFAGVRPPRQFGAELQFTY